MITLDPHTISEKVRQNDYPADWRVFRARRNQDQTCSGYLFFLALGAFIGMIAAFVTRLPTLAWLIGLGIFVGLSAWLIFTQRREGRSLLVILPEGVVECPGEKNAKETILQFDKIRHMDSENVYWLNIYGYHGEYTKWEIDSEYGDLVIIGGNIISAYQYYQQRAQHQ